MDKLLLSGACILSFFSSFSMNPDNVDDYVSRNELRSNVVKKIDSIETNIDMVRGLNSGCIDENTVQTFINDKTIERDRLINALSESDSLVRHASKIDSSIELASELRGSIEDEALDAYLNNMQEQYNNTLNKSRKILED